MKRIFLFFALLLFVLAGCGASTASSPTTVPAAPTSAPAVATAAPQAAPTAAPIPTAPPTAAAAPTEAAPSADAFPVTIAHKFGSTEIKSAPKRIVTVGLTDQDALLALGVVPVGTTEWYGNQPSAIWPWAQSKLGGAKPELVGDASAINFEKIAALKPDAIVALYSGITKEQYNLLTQIAPTVAQPADYVDYGIPWEESTHIIGKIVGQTQQANKLVADVEARFAKVRAEHPEFGKATALVVTPYQGIYVYGPQDNRSRVLESFGFKLPAELGAITGTSFGANISAERTDLLNVGALVWLDVETGKGPIAEPVYTKLAVHTEGREIFLKGDNQQGGAFSFVSVLSLPYLIDELTPAFAAAADGDPQTVVKTFEQP